MSFSLPPETGSNGYKPVADRVEIPKKFLPLYKPFRYKCFYGGRGGAKTESFARALLHMAFGKKLNILCCREYQSSIADSVHRTLAATIDELGWSPFFNVTKTEITCWVTGSRFTFKGIRLHALEIKSMKGIDVAWVEEAETVTPESWAILEPTIRNPGSEIWISFNPSDPKSYTYNRFVIEGLPDKITRVDVTTGERSLVPYALTVKVNWRDNPWFPQDLDDLRRYTKQNDQDAYMHIWEGEPRFLSDAMIFADKVRVASFGEPPIGTRFYYGLDFGFARDPTCLLRMWIERLPPQPGDPVEMQRERLYISHEAYGVKVDLPDLAGFFDSNVPGCRAWPILADSARPEVISYLQRQGFVVDGVEKWDGSVKDGIAHLRAYDEIVIHERCKGTAGDFQMYRYKEDPKYGHVLPIPEDRNNHGVDACRYGLDTEIKTRGVDKMWSRL